MIFKISDNGFTGNLRLLIYLLYTKIFYRSSRIIRFPIYIRGRKHIDFGSKLTTGVGCRFEAFENKKSNVSLKFGKNVQLNDLVHISAMCEVTIGNDVLIASKVYISDCTHGIYSNSDQHTDPKIKPINRPYSTSPVRIGNNVWLGESVSVLPGVSIGDGAIIGANSLVNKSIPPNCIAVGSPARPIKIFNEKTNKWEKI